VEHASSTRFAGYRRPIPDDWWLKKYRYFMYMMRELTALFAALWVIGFLVQLPMMAGYPENMAAYNAWLDYVRSPWWILFSFICLIFVLYHAVTFINLMGTVMTARFGKIRIGGGMVVAPMMLAWLGITILLAAIIMVPLIGV
jgi:fumarate reductase subunit C